MNGSTHQLRQIHFAILLTLGIAVLLMSLMAFNSQIANHEYWGEISNSLAFEIIGALMVYAYLLYRQYNVPYRIKQSSIDLVVWAVVVVIVLLLIIIGINELHFGQFVDSTFQNFFLAIIGAVLIFFFLDRFILLLQEHEQQVDSLRKRKQDMDTKTERQRMMAEMDSLQKTVETQYQELSNLQDQYNSIFNELNDLKSVKNRIDGILSHKRSYSFCQPPKVSTNHK